MTKPTNHRSTQAELRPAGSLGNRVYLNERDLVGALLFAACEQPTGYILATYFGSPSGENT
jgi:hypothetical protein